MAALTPVDVANMALGLLTEAPIDSLDEDTRAARMLNLHYETTRESELTAREWVFARLSKQVDAAETGDNEWPYAYELPADALRALPVIEHGVELPWRQEGSQVFTRWGGVRKISYIGNLIDPNDWPSVFTDVLAAAIAMKIAHPITGKASMYELSKDAYQQAVRRAYQVNALSKGSPRPNRSWTDARRGYVGVNGFARIRHGGGA